MHSSNVSIPMTSWPKAPDYPEFLGDKRLREEILDERAREYLLRGRSAGTIWCAGSEATSSKSPSTASRITGNASALEFSDPQPEPVRAWTNNFDPKWYLSAFPSDEVNKGYGLVQNPGWVDDC